MASAACRLPELDAEREALNERAEGRLTFRFVIKEYLVVIQVPIIPNHAPATNTHSCLTVQQVGRCGEWNVRLDAAVCERLQHDRSARQLEQRLLGGGGAQE